MAETTIENQVCNVCGAEVRKDALFCYHCGSQIAPEVVPVQKGEIKIQENNSDTAAVKTNTKQAEKSVIQKASEVETGKPEPIKETGLKSAAAMRKKPKSIQPKKVEIIWEERDDLPNTWFILVAVFLTIVAGVILFLALRMR